MELIGESPALAQIRAQMARLRHLLARARRLPPVLLEGETGTGKGLVARLLHQEGPRAKGPFVAVNCAAVPSTLLEAELFGFERGAFTDARRAKAGLFTAAHGGVLFLDEIALLPLDLQGKLLQALEEGTVRPLGSTHSVSVDVWIIAATNENVDAAVRAGRMRSDLYHRLAGLPLRLPPLRERGEDVVMLAERFLAKACADYGVPAMRLDPSAVRGLLRYSWPGNVRELANVIDRAVLRSDSEEIGQVSLALPDEAASIGPSPSHDSDLPLRAVVDRVERERLVRALTETGWNISVAATRLGIPRNTLRYRMSRYGLRAETRTVRGPDADEAVSTSDSPRRFGERQIAWLQVRLHRTGAAEDKLSDVLAALVDKVEFFEGHVVEISHDGILAAFGIEPMEDGGRRAAHAGLAVQRTLVGRVGWSQLTLPASLALDTCPGLVEETSGRRRLVSGSQEKARAALAPLLAIGSVGQLIAPVSAAGSIERWFEIERLSKPAEAESAGVCRIVRPRASGQARPVDHRVTPFVGRERELELLIERVERLSDRGGQVIGIVTEPGGGKSRLLQEFRQGIERRSVTYLEGRCASHGGNSPYLPVLDVLRRAWGLTDTDGPDALAHAIRREMARLAMDPDELAPYVLRLFGLSRGTEPLDRLSAEAVKRRTFDVVREIILRQGEPIVLAIEDLHWIDKTSEDLLGSVVDSTSGASLLFLTSYRPGYRPPWIDRSYVTQLALAPLTSSDSRTVVTSILPARLHDDRLIDDVVTRGEGNPFFLEELATAVVQQPRGDVARAVPRTIDEVLTARLDRLPEPARQVLSTAAVLGREAPLRLLAAMRGIRADVGERLTELVRHEFLHEQAGAGGRVYGFKHSLIQEVAYARQSPAERAERHAAAGEALETLYAGRLDEVLDQIAHHFTLAPHAAKAVAYLSRFGEKLITNYALVEASTAFRRGLSMAETLTPGIERDQLIARVLPSLSSAMVLLGQIPEALELLTRYEAFVERLDDPSLNGPYYFQRALVHNHLGESARAVSAAQRGLEEAAKANDAVTQGQIRFVLALEEFLAGRCSAGEAHALTGITLLEPHRANAMWPGALHWTLAQNRIVGGPLEPALDAVERLESLATRTADPRSLSYARWLRGWITSTHLDPARGMALCEESLATAPDPLAEAASRIFLGGACLEAGNASRAIGVLEIALRRYEEFRIRPMIGWSSAWLSEAVAEMGRTDHARHLANHAVQTCESIHFQYGLGFGRRAQGRIAKRTGDVGEAVEQLSRALGLFNGVGARYEEARTHYDLAEVMGVVPDQDLAVTHLKAAHDLFAQLGSSMWVDRSERLRRERGWPVRGASG